VLAYFSVQLMRVCFECTNTTHSNKNMVRIIHSLQGGGVQRKVVSEDPETGDIGH